MAKKTVLEIVQYILTTLGSDEVNSITDTTEASDIAEIMEVEFSKYVLEFELSRDLKFLTLTESGDSTLPNIMYLPSNVNEIKQIKYHSTETTDRELWETIGYLEPVEFLERMHQRNSNEPNVSEVVRSYPTGNVYTMSLMIKTQSSLRL